MKRYLEAIKLCYAHYRQPLCLRDVSFEVSKGKKLLLLGVAEVGKTTLLKSICGFDKTYIGEVRFDGKNIKTIKDEEKKFSLLLSDPVLVKGSVRKNIDYLCEIENLPKISKEELLEVFKKFGFDKNEEDNVKSLSLLEKRVLAMIRTYLKKPKAVFVDDQFEGLGEEDFQRMVQAFNSLFELDSVMVIASGGAGFLKNHAFFESVGFESVLYLGLLKSYRYKSIAEFLEKKINFGVMEFCDTHKIVEGFVIRQNGAYYFKQGELLRKFDKIFYDKLSLLSIVDDEDEKVELAIKNEINFEKISDVDFNKYLKLGDFLLFSRLDDSRVI